MKVLLATDGSPSATIAHQLVAGLDWPPATELTVLFVLPEYLEVYSGSAPGIVPIETGEQDAAFADEANRIVQAAAAAVTGTGRSVTPIVRRGRPASMIVAEAGRLGADLVVMGNRGIGGVESLLLGSVSSEVVDHAPSPVLVVRTPRLERILLTVDGSGAGCRPAQVLETWPIFRHAAVRVLSVSQVRLPWWSGLTIEAGSLVGIYADAETVAHDQHQALVDDVVAVCRGEGMRVEGAVREGIPEDEILHDIRDWQPDLVILGCRSRGGLERLLVGSVARDVLHHAHCSVLVVREGATVDADAPATARPA